MSSQAPSISELTSTQVKEKRRNYSKLEDQNLCRAYLLVTSTCEKKGTTFWKRIDSTFKDLMGDDFINRDTKRSSNMTRWALINQVVCKYVAILSQVENSRTLGSDDESNREEAAQIFLNECKKPYNLEHCRRILCTQPKWQTNVKSPNNNRKKGKGKVLPVAHTKDRDESSESEDDACFLGPLRLCKRDRNEHRDLITTYLKALVDDLEEEKIYRKKKTLFMEEILRDRVIALDPKDITDPTYREYVKMQQQEYLLLL